MRILVYGIGKDNPNYRKIEGFFNAFSKAGETEWVSDISYSKSNFYDIIFGEISLNDVLSMNHKKFIQMKIGALIIWKSFDLKTLIKLAELKPDTLIINYYKSNILNSEILIQYKKLFGSKYQFCPGYDEGIFIENFLDLNQNKLPRNLKLGYLPCCLSENSHFIEDKLYDIVYFGTIKNRPIVDYIVKKLSRKYKIYLNFADKNKLLSPNDCFDLYKISKITLSQQVHPVILELPVRLGEASANGCRVFNYETIRCNYKNQLIPNYTSSNNVDLLIFEIENYILNFNIQNSINLKNSFSATYDNAVKKILVDINQFGNIFFSN